MNASIALAMLAAMLLGGCTTQNIKADAPLAADEGILVTDIHCGVGVKWFEFHAPGHSTKGYLGSMKQAATVHCPVFGGADQAVRTIRLKQGRYLVGKVGHETELSFEDGQAVSFSVEAGKLTYIGGLRVQSTPHPTDARTYYVDLRVIDDEARVKTQLQRDYPALLDRLPWQKRLAQDAPRSGQVPAALSP